MWPAPIWAPAAIAFFCLIVGGSKWCLGVAIGSFLTNTVSFGQTTSYATVVALGNTLGPLLGAALFRPHFSTGAPFSRVKESLRFLGSVFMGGIISGAIALVGHWSKVNVASLTDWLDWTLSDCAAVVSLTPLLLLVAQPIGCLSLLRSRPTQIGVSVLSTIGAVIYMLYGKTVTHGGNAGGSFLVLLPLLWVATTLSLSFSYVMFVGVMLTILSATMIGSGPFAGVERESVLTVFAQMVVGFGGSLLMLGSAANEQRASDEALHKLNSDLERRVELRTAALEASQKRLAQAALYDHLTRLPNRRLLENRFHSAGENARRSSDRLTLMVLDLDHFKEINDGFGHDAGDAVLIEVACRLSSLVRQGDTVARLGGDEFCLLMDYVHDPELLDATCRRILGFIRAPITHNEHELHVGCSIGVALYPDHGDSWTDLYRSADVALYQSKQDGRNTYHIAEIRYASQ